MLIHTIMSIEKRTWWTSEFTLVLIMLAVLTILVTLIHYSPIQQPRVKVGDDYIRETQLYFEQTLEYRKNILAIILTAFGAWVGAGAAYFFGRENLRESANSLLQIHRQMTGQEKLKNITVKDIPPKVLDIIIQETTPFKDVMDKFTADPKMWFIPIKLGDKWLVVIDEALHLYLISKVDEKYKTDTTQNYINLRNTVLNMPMKDVAEDLKNFNVLTNLINRFLPVTMSSNVAEVNDKMEKLNVFLALVADEKGNYTHYFTTSDIRKALLKV